MKTNKSFIEAKQPEKGKVPGYREGIRYKYTEKPMALCHCGCSHHKPFCDGTHIKIDWDITLTTKRISLHRETKLYPVKTD